MAYEQRRAEKAGVSLAQWFETKIPKDTLAPLHRCDDQRLRRPRRLFRLTGRQRRDTGRHEAYCGLHVDDIITDNGDIPYIHIAANEFRRIKNTQSTRNLALHPELIRLGFLGYVEAIRALSYTRVFPDLYSPSTKSPLGDRLYDQLLPSFRAVGFTPHQVRHFFGDELKQSEVSQEFRADLLGHGGDTETTERYCNPLATQRQMPHLLKLPLVTAHLESRPIRLLPWIVARNIAPWSRSAKAARQTATANGWRVATTNGRLRTRRQWRVS